MDLERNDPLLQASRTWRAPRRRAKLRHVTHAGCVRIVLKEHLKALCQNDMRLNQSHIVLQRFHSHIKQFILICRGLAVATKLTSTERRDNFETAAWKAGCVTNAMLESEDR
jgi:hypothetical protein